MTLDSSPHPLHELRLDSLAFGGDAVGRLNGKVVFVPFGVPGDRILVRLTEEHPSYSRGEIVQVLQEGPGRRLPPCPAFGTCGGCQWQQLAYDRQAVSKSDILARILSEAAVQELKPLTKAPVELGYRRRVRLHFRKTRQRLWLGYFRRHSKELVDVPDCALLQPVLQRALALCRDRLERVSEARGSLVLLAGALAETHLSLRLEEGHLADPSSFLADPIVGGLVQQGGRVTPFGRDAVNLAPLPEAPLWATAAAFAQANSEQDQLLRHRVARWAEAKDRRVLELFAGIGNLTRELAQHASEVVAVEASAPATELLRRNVLALPRPVQICEEEASAALERLLAARERFDVAVLDPPREGHAHAVDRLGKLGPERVIYVSCDPMTLARDLNILAKHGYVSRQAQGQDMMPQTFHIEAVVRLDRK